jgi:Trypsin-like peptidase domain
VITANVIHRVFRIRFGASRGSGFAVDVDGRQYLVTARHVLPDLKNEGRLEIFADQKWQDFACRLVGHATGDIDISVVAVDKLLTPPKLPIELSMAGLIYGQDAYFLGFPYDDLVRYGLGEGGYALPFVKKAIVSCFDGGLMYLDGHNNPGFSGGPVVYQQPGKADFRIAGTISAFRREDLPVYSGDRETGLTYRYNTGIVVAHSIEYAVELIRARPIGVRLDE